MYEKVRERCSNGISPSHSGSRCGQAKRRRIGPCLDPSDGLHYQVSPRSSEDRASAFKSRGASSRNSERVEWMRLYARKPKRQAVGDLQATALRTFKRSAAREPSETIRRTPEMAKT